MASYIEGDDFRSASHFWLGHGISGWAIEPYYVIRFINNSLEEFVYDEKKNMKGDKWRGSGPMK